MLMMYINEKPLFNPTNYCCTNRFRNLPLSLCFLPTVLVVPRHRQHTIQSPFARTFSRSVSSTSTTGVSSSTPTSASASGPSTKRTLRKKPQRRPPGLNTAMQHTLKAANTGSASKGTTLITNTSANRRPLSQKPRSIFSKLHRLRSIEDRRWVHKIGSVTCMLSTLSLSAYGLVSNAYSEVSFPPLAVMNPLVALWAMSVTVQAVSGGVMAVKFRRREHCVRDAFVANSLLSLLNVVVTIRTVYHSVLANRFIAPLCMSALAFVLKTLCSANATIHSRRAPARHSLVDQSSARGKLQDFCKYVLPQVIPVPFIVAAFNFFALHDQSWVAQQFHTGQRLREVCVYANVLGTLGISVVSLLVTLRDRKMISKGRESNLIFASSFASLGLTMWLIHSSPGIPYFLNLVALDYSTLL